MQVFMWTCFQLKYILKRLVARLYDKSTLTFVKKQPNCLPRLFHFSFPPAVMRVPVVPHPHKQILSIFFLSYIDGCVVVSHCLVCNSLVTCNVRYLFICIFATFIQSLVKYLFISFLYFLLSLFTFLSVKTSLRILDVFFIRYVLGNYFLSVCAFSFHSFNSSFHRADIFTFLKCIL